MFVVIPPEGFIKVNIDGSSFGNLGNADFWGLLRNGGNWIYVFSWSFGRASNLLVELLAILEKLQLACDLRYRSIVMEFDSQAVLELIADTKHNDLTFILHNFIISY